MEIALGDDGNCFGGHAARNKANRKVRQPLAEAAFSVGSADEREVISTYAEMLEDELNVKHVRALDAASEAVSYVLKPTSQTAGSKIWQRLPRDPQSSAGNGS